MGLVQQGGMVGVGLVDEGLGRFYTAGVEGDGDDLEAFRVELLTQLLPHGQVEAAASPRRPCEEQDLLTS